MDKSVEIISRETVKPSSPTPDFLRTYNLSFLDQIAVHVFVPITLFYPSTGQSSSEISYHLKKSFAETLTHFYPLAGTKNGSTIECNDDGATFIEARVHGDMSLFLKQKDNIIDWLQQLVPFNPHDNAKDMVAVQVTYFSCTALAISISLSHEVGDASTAAMFLEAWAAITSGVHGISGGLTLDWTSIFPTIDGLNFSLDDYFLEKFSVKTVAKRFVFHGSKIAALKKKIGGNGTCIDRPTRFEAVSALIWGAVIAATSERDRTVEEHVATTIVDLRKRMNPPLPQQCMGNVWQMATAFFSIGDTIDYTAFAGKIHQSIGNINGEFMRKLDSFGMFMDILEGSSQEQSEERSKTEAFALSSWCRLPLYTTDFGWGKPIWVGTVLGNGNAAVFIDTPDGEGIEAWVRLPVEDMARFESNSQILEYASFIPSS